MLRSPPSSGGALAFHAPRPRDREGYNLLEDLEEATAPPREALLERDAWSDPEAVAEYVGSVRGSSPVNEYIEKPALRGLMSSQGSSEGPLTGLALSDLGAGAGDFACECARRGARSVVAVEASAAMLALAPAHPRVRYVHAAMEQLELPRSSVNGVVSSMALQYVADVPAVLERVHRCLQDDGWFAFTVEHPLMTANSRGHWLEDAAWPVDRYLEEGAIRDRRGDLVVVRWHRTLSTWVTLLLTAGFSVEAVVEPAGTAPGWEAAPDRLAQNRRCPAVLGIRARRRPAQTLIP